MILTHFVHQDNYLKLTQMYAFYNLNTVTGSEQLKLNSWTAFSLYKKKGITGLIYVIIYWACVNQTSLKKYIYANSFPALDL